MTEQTYQLATIGYQSTTVPAFLRALTDAGVALLVDVRAVAASRRAGFAKTALAANLDGAGIGYIHLRRLGTPADGRAAARAGRTAEMHEIFGAHMATQDAKEALWELQELVTGGGRVAIMCFEADHSECHRTLIANALAERIPLVVTNLQPDIGTPAPRAADDAEPENE